jgi:signal transduction histidine kinase
MNLILPSPFFANQNWIAVGPLFSTAIVISIFYAIYRYNLFATKVITTEILTFIIWFALLMRSLLSEGTISIITNYGLLAVITVFGVFLVRSVHEEVRAREEAVELTEKLKKLNQEKSRMLSIASHQFRSPLTSIEGYASMIQDGSYGEVPDYLQEPIDRILKSSQKLAHIVDDFLNISRIEDGRMDYNVKPADVAEATKAVVEEVQGSIDKQKQDLHFETDESSDYPAKVDVGKFQQVITNLVDNAIKYTEEGNITVRVKRKHSSIIIEVEDEGIGIDPADTDKIFSQFARADEAQAVNVSGSGLGLYIARQIINAHDGKIWATSPGQGKGATFHVRIPAADETDK